MPRSVITGSYDKTVCKLCRTVQLSSKWLYHFVLPAMNDFPLLCIIATLDMGSFEILFVSLDSSVIHVGLHIQTEFP